MANTARELPDNLPQRDDNSPILSPEADRAQQREHLLQEQKISFIQSALSDITSQIAELGTAMKVVLVLVFTLTIALAVVQVLQLLQAVYALAFLVILMFVLLELRSTPQRRFAIAFDQTRLLLDDETKQIFRQAGPSFAKKYEGILRDLQGSVAQCQVEIVDRMKASYSADVTFLWKVVQTSIVLFYVFVLVIAGTFLLLVARENATKIGVLRADFTKTEIPVNPPETAVALLPGEAAKDVKDVARQSRLQTTKVKEWIAAGAAPKSSADAERLVVVETAAQFERYYNQFIARIHFEDHNLYQVTAGAAFLFTNKDDLTTYRQIGFAVLPGEKGDDRTALYCEPDNGESLLVILKILEIQPLEQEIKSQKKTYGRSPEEYRLSLVLAKPKVKSKVKGGPDDTLSDNS